MHGIYNHVSLLGGALEGILHVIIWAHYARNTGAALAKKK